MVTLEETPIAKAETFEPVFNVKYRVKCGDPKVLQSGEMSHVVTTTTIPPCDPPEGCIEVGISLDDTIIVDPSYAGLEPICVEPVQLCFNSCGDVYPRATCGNGSVNLFDILEEIDFALGIEEPSVCQAEQGNVPTGTPSDDCVAPDDEINVFDVLVIIDKSLKKPNCCDAYNLGD
jgi:hypothetical protein